MEIHWKHTISNTDVLRISFSNIKHFELTFAKSDQHDFICVKWLENAEQVFVRVQHTRRMAPTMVQQMNRWRIRQKHAAKGIMPNVNRRSPLRQNSKYLEPIILVIECQLLPVEQRV